MLRPFTVAGERVAQPFRDVYAWADSLLTARSDAKKLREENAVLRQQAIQNQFAANENDTLKALLAFRDGPRFPDDYKGLAAAVIARPTGGYAQDVVVAVGSNDGVTIDAPVVTEDGFLGRVTRVYSRSARVTLLTDEQLAVSALDVKSGAAGIVKHGRASASTLIFDRVPKKLKVAVATRSSPRGGARASSPRSIRAGSRSGGSRASVRRTRISGSRSRWSRSPTSTVSTPFSCSCARRSSRDRRCGGAYRADRLRRRHPAGLGFSSISIGGASPDVAPRHPRRDRAPPRRHRRRCRRVRRRATRRRRHPRARSASPRSCSRSQASGPGVTGRPRAAAGRTPRSSPCSPRPSSSMSAATSSTRCSAAPC